jgi:uncharacterized protein YndB with AHSA1/START domain
MVFSGTFREVEPPARTVETWRYNGWPEVEAIESLGFREIDGVTTLTIGLSFKDEAGRACMSSFEGFEWQFERMDELLRSLVDSSSAVSG